MIRAFTELTEDLKTRGINQVFHFADNEASTALKMTMKTMDIKYQLVTPINHRDNNAEKYIHTFKNHFKARLCSVDKDFHLQLWKILLYKTTISINLLRQSRILPQL